MSLEELLPVYAEISIALAGFVGVVSAFAGRERDYRPTELSRFAYVLMCAASVLAGCLAFFSTVGGDFSASSGCQAAAVASFLATGILATQTIPGAWRHAGDPDSTTELWALYVGTGAVAFVLVLFVLSAFSGGSSLPLLAGFSIQLIAGLWMFARLLTRAN